MAQALVNMSLEQKFTTNLLKNLENSTKSVIWTRDKYNEVLESVRNGKRDSYYYLNK